MDCITLVKEKVTLGLRFTLPQAYESRGRDKIQAPLKMPALEAASSIPKEMGGGGGGGAVF